VNPSPHILPVRPAVEVMGEPTAELTRGFWLAFGAIAAGLLDDEDPAGDDHGELEAA